MRFRDYMRKACNNILPHFVLRGMNILFNEGLYTFIYKIREHTRSGKIYEKWITEKEKKEIESGMNFEYCPLISVIVPVYNVKENILRECIESVIAQSYDNWQLCMADDCSTLPDVKNVLLEYEKIRV